MKDDKCFPALWCFPDAARLKVLWFHFVPGGEMNRPAFRPSTISTDGLEIAQLVELFWAFGTKFFNLFLDELLRNITPLAGKTLPIVCGGALACNCHDNWQKRFHRNDHMKKIGKTPFTIESPAAVPGMTGC